MIIIFNLIYVLGCMVSVSLFAERKYNNILIYLVSFFAIGFLSCLISYYWPSELLLIDIFILVSCFVYKVTLFKGKIYKAVDEIAMYAIFSIIPISISSFLFNTYVLDDHTIDTSYLIILIILYITTFSIFFCFKKYKTQLRYDGRAIIPASAVLIIVIVCFVSLRSDLLAGYSPIIIAVIAYICVLLNILISRIHLYKTDLDKKIKENVILNKNIDYKDDQISSLRYLYASSFSFVHDYIHCIQKIRKRLEDSDIAEATRLVTALEDDLLNNFNVLYTNSRNITAVLEQYLPLFNEAAIHVKTEIRSTDLHFLDDELQLKPFSMLNEIVIDVNKDLDMERIYILKTLEENDIFLIKALFSGDIMNNDYAKDMLKTIERTFRKMAYISTTKKYENYTQILIAFKQS